MPALTRRKRHHIWDIPKKDIAELKRMRLPWWGVLCVIVGTFSVRPLFLRMGRVELGIPVLMSIGVFGFLLVVKWRLRRYAWFWSTVVAFIALHVVLLCVIPWTKEWVPVTMTAGIASLDLLAMLAIISVVGHLCGGEI